MTNPTRIEVLAPVALEHIEFAQSPEHPWLFTGKAIVVHLYSQLRIDLSLTVHGDAPEELNWLSQMRGLMFAIDEPGKSLPVLALPVRYDPLNEPKYSLITGSRPAVLTRW